MLSNRSFTNFKVTAPNDALEIFETNFMRAMSRNSVVLRRVALQICCQLKFPKHFEISETASVLSQISSKDGRKM